MWQLETWFVYFYTWVVRWSADLLSTDYWLFFHVRAHLHTGEIKAGLFATKFHVFSSVHLSILFPAYSVTSQHKGVQIEIWIMALFFNQMYESGLKAVISTCFSSDLNQVKWRVVKLKWYTSLWSVRDTKIAFFKYIYLWRMWVVLKSTKFLLQAMEISMFFLHIFSSLGVCPLGMIVTCLGMDGTQIGVFK